MAFLDPQICRALRRVFENEMADRGVRRRNMVEAMRHLRLRAARDQPHHEFDAFRTSLSDVFDVRHLREALGVVDQPVEEYVVPLLVDQAGARPLKLMAHAAGTPDLDVEILGIAPDRLSDRLSEGEAAGPRRHGMLHDIDGERYDLARPRVDLAENAA